MSGIRPSDFTRVIREDPEKRGLLYAGTERGVWVSFNDGASWQSLQMNLPPVPIHDLVVKEGDIVLASHGRSFWILDDISVLRQLGADLPQKDIPPVPAEAGVPDLRPARRADQLLAQELGAEGQARLSRFQGRADPELHQRRA